MRDAEDDAGKKWNGGNVLLVGRLVGGDEGKSVFEDIELSECGLVNGCSGNVGGSW